MKIRSILMLSAIALSTFATKAQNRVVLIEEGTGTWCQWCPRGIVLGKDILKANKGKVLMIAAHQNDPMEISGSNYVSSLAISGYPGGNIDRVNKSIDPLNWQSSVTSRLAVSSPVDVTVNRSYNSSNRELTVTVNAKFNQAVPSGNYGIGLVITEDGVTGTDSKYAQSNKYSGGGNGVMGGFEKLPTPVPASIMVYDHVARNLVTPYNGETGIIPAVPAVGQTYSKVFKITLNSSFNPEYIRAISYVTNAAGEILNAGGSEYAQGDDNAPPFFHSYKEGTAQVNVPFSMPVLCHDPDNDQLTITAVSGLPSWLKLNASGKDDAELTGTPTTAGTHNITLEVSDGTKKSTETYTVVVNPKGSSWIQVGQEGFSSVASNYISPSSIDLGTGNLYTMAINSNNTCFVYKNEGKSWTQLGNSISTSTSLYGDIAFNSATNEPWIIVKESQSNAKVYKYTNSKWEAVGSSFAAVGNLNIKISPSGKAYVAYSMGGSNLEVRNFDGTSWTKFTSISSTNLLSWPKLELNKLGNPIILAAEFASQTGYSTVYEYDGTKWVRHGSGAINPSEYTNPSSSSAHQIAVSNNGDIYVAIAFNSGTNIYKWGGLNWATIGTNIDNGIADAFDLEVSSTGKVFVVYQAGTNKATCKVWDGNSWKAVGVPNFTNTIKNISMFMYAHGNPGVVYADMSIDAGKLGAKRYAYPTSVEQSQTSSTSSLTIYPNPTTGLVHINGQKVNGKAFIVSDLQGSKVKTGHVTANSISIADVAPGIYVLSVQGESKQIKLIKL